jgi:CubicO group peptidase (beta-lactamase class C family)
MKQLMVSGPICTFFIIIVLVGCLGFSRASAQVEGSQAAAIIDLAREAMTKYQLKAAIVRVTIDGEEVVTKALGESITGVPATEDMHFRNGAVAISYMSTLLLQLVDQDVLSLDDKLSNWLPELPDAERVTLRMLANMTAGYPDYVPNAKFVEAFFANPFRQWTPQELIDMSLSTPRLFDPGTNWDYSHTNYVILGEVLEEAMGKPLATLLQENVLNPLKLKDTANSSTAAIPEPILHAFSSERREALGIASSTRFYEESTFWNPSWTLPKGAIQTTNIYDMTATAVAVGEGTLLSLDSHQAQVAPSLVGFGSTLKGCPNCHTLDQTFNYGLGVVRSGSWILQNPAFGGYSAVEAYLPSKKIAVAVVTTYAEESFDVSGNYKYGYGSEKLFAAIGAYLAPDEAPLAR